MVLYARVYYGNNDCFGNFVLTIFYSFNVKFIMTVVDTNQNIPTYCEYDEDESAT